MLKTTKSINLSGQSTLTVDGREVVAVQLSANIYTSGNSTNIVSTIVNQDVYDANKVICRADIDSFTSSVREYEDSVIAKAESEVTE